MADHRPVFNKSGNPDNFSLTDGSLSKCFFRFVYQQICFNYLTKPVF